MRTAYLQRPNSILLCLIALVAICLPWPLQAQKEADSPLNPVNGQSELSLTELSESDPAAALRLRDLALYWSDLPADGLLSSQGCRYRLQPGASALTVVHLDGQALATMCRLTIAEAADTTILVNVSGQAINWARPDVVLADVDPERLLFNFYEAESLTIGQGQLEGTVLAPLAQVTGRQFSLQGLLLARTVAGQRDTSFAPFNGDLPELSYDFGDLPDGAYFATLLVDDGARHALNEPLYLGQEVDAELDGQPDASAWGDGQDESGVYQVGSWRDGPAGGPMEIHVGAGEGCLNGWFDLDEDGRFGADEHLLTNLAVSAAGTGRYEVALDLPAGTIKNPTLIYARFRLTPRTVANNCTETVAPAGFVNGGEVEDYFWPSNPEPTAVNWAGFSPLGLLESPFLPALLLVSIMASILVMVGITLFKSRTSRDLRQ